MKSRRKGGGGGVFCFGNPESGTFIKFDNRDQNKLLANQTSSYSSRDMLS